VPLSLVDGVVAEMMGEEVDDNFRTAFVLVLHELRTMKFLPLHKKCMAAITTVFSQFFIESFSILLASGRIL